VNYVASFLLPFGIGLAITLVISLALYGIVRAIGWVIGGFMPEPQEPTSKHPAASPFSVPVKPHRHLDTAVSAVRLSWSIADIHIPSAMLDRCREARQCEPHQTLRSQSLRRPRESDLRTSHTWLLDGLNVCFRCLKRTSVGLGRQTAAKHNFRAPRLLLPPNGMIDRG